MNLFFKISTISMIILLLSCNEEDSRIESENTEEVVNPFETDFTKASSIAFSNFGEPEISAYDSLTKKVFSTNTKAKTVEVIDLSDVKNPKLFSSIDITPYGGNLNSVAVKNGQLAIAIEGVDSAADKGRIVVFNTNNLTTPIINLEAGYLPDMVVFSPNGKYILSANEGEPNVNNTIDPEGSVSIIDIENKTISNLDFSAFNSDEESLEANGFRVFGETNGVKNNLAVDVEPEYIAVSDDSRTAYVVLQENNGIAVVDIITKQITSILPLGAKDFNEIGNTFDVNDKDGVIQLNNWNVKSFYMPDTIDFFTIDGIDYLITANEGDSRDYDGYSEEARVKDLILDPIAYPNAETLQTDEALGRLKTTIANGDIDNDGDVDQVYAYGGRSYSIWTTSGVLIYDSGNFLIEKTIELGTYPDNRSDDKGTEPESVTTLNVDGYLYAFIGLERSGNVFVFNITNPRSPEFLQNLENTSPEGLLVVTADESPNGKELLIVSNESPEDAELVIYSK